MIHVTNLPPKGIGKNFPSKRSLTINQRFTIPFSSQCKLTQIPSRIATNVV